MSAGQAATLAPAVGRPVQRPARLLRRSWRYPQTKIGVVVFTAVVLLMLVGPFIAPHSPTAYVAVPGSGSRPGALFGTDVLGRDVWSRFLHGGVTVLWMSVLSAALGEIFGIAVGLAP